MPEIPTTPEIIEAAIDRRVQGLHTAMPGKIISYDEPAQTCSIQLAVRLGGVVIAPLQDVPVLLPGAWGEGDSFLVVFAESDFSAWFLKGDVDDPPEVGRHGLYALAIPMVRSGDVVDFVALAAKVDTELAKILDLLQTWTVAPNDGGLALQTAAIALSLASVSAAKDKAR